MKKNKQTEKTSKGIAEKLTRRKEPEWRRKKGIKKNVGNENGGLARARKEVMRMGEQREQSDEEGEKSNEMRTEGVTSAAEARNI